MSFAYTPEPEIANHYEAPGRPSPPRSELPNIRKRPASEVNSFDPVPSSVSTPPNNPLYPAVKEARDKILTTRVPEDSPLCLLIHGIITKSSKSGTYEITSTQADELAEFAELAITTCALNEYEEEVDVDFSTFLTRISTKLSGVDSSIWKHLTKGYTIKEQDFLLPMLKQMHYRLTFEPSNIATSTEWIFCPPVRSKDMSLNEYGHKLERWINCIPLAFRDYALQWFIPNALIKGHLCNYGEKVLHMHAVFRSRPVVNSVKELIDWFGKEMPGLKSPVMLPTQSSPKRHKRS